MSSISYFPRKMASGGDPSGNRHITTTKAVLFTAKVKILTITGDQSTIEQQESRQECSHVMVERHENDEHKIVVLKQITEEEKTEVMNILYSIKQCSVLPNLVVIYSLEQ